MHVKLLDAKIVSINDLSPTVKGYTLKVTDGYGACHSFKAGQW